MALVSFTDRRSHETRDSRLIWRLPIAAEGIQFGGFIELCGTRATSSWSFCFRQIRAISLVSSVIPHYLRSPRKAAYTPSSPDRMKLKQRERDENPTPFGPPAASHRVY